MVNFISKIDQEASKAMKFKNSLEAAQKFNLDNLVRTFDIQLSKLKPKISKDNYTAKHQLYQMCTGDRGMWELYNPSNN